ncbi:hypothetical protein RB2501_06310 [Robiginitalea biformata HTCC2501]|uniref:Uncharacterized protein n=1 Tax=Robiginitalea biformata (strain ATCC BAA-864 / DSM 15991 / KCTC 12146 / HTCC2501) TaxID=313596 RepID=A4CHT2_ROBBH|nr:hypothetical protein RB2501_06310 [Robiginitalea biformata HTCC2501]
MHLLIRASKKEGQDEDAERNGVTSGWFHLTQVFCPNRIYLAGGNSGNGPVAGNAGFRDENSF